MFIKVYALPSEHWLEVCVITVPRCLRGNGSQEYKKGTTSLLNQLTLALFFNICVYTSV